MEIKEYLLKLCKAEKIELSEKQCEDFSLYGEFLVSYNEKVNLTTIVEPSEIVVKHFLDSLMVLKYVEFKRKAKIIDVGTGAGFPSMPLKIVRNDIEVTLLDSLNKRLIFLTELCEKLGLSARNVHARAEMAGIDPKLREKFDFATSRAVSSLAALAEYSLPLLKKGGTMIALKGPDCEKEIEEAKRAVKILGGGNIKAFKYVLPDNSGRTLITIEKLLTTPKKYPRQRVKISDNPI